MAVYRRILLKLSGEALKSDRDLFDFDKVNQVASIIRRMHDMGVEIGIVIGAGNIWRGRQGGCGGTERCGYASLCRTV